MKAINPSNGQLIKEYPNHTTEDIEGCLKAQEGAFKEWAKVSGHTKSQIMTKLGDLLRQEVEIHAKMITLEMGKPIREARTEVLKCAAACHYFAEITTKQFEEEIIDSDAELSYVTFQPLGIILGIMPWNFPYWQVFRFAAPTIMAGNAILIKHAPNVPGCTLAIEDLFLRAGFPPNLFRTLLIEIEKVSQIIEDERIRGISLTGSEKAGATVASLAGQHVKKTVLELGGSDPFIVLDDVDLEFVIENAAKGRLINTGQSCIASKRFIISAKIFDPFCHLLIQKVQSLKIGDPMSEKSDLGPIAREDLLITLQKQVEDSLNKGAKVLIGGKRLDQPGFFYPPTILTHVSKGMRVHDEETFGPIFSLATFNTLAEAIHMANDTKYGLGASIWTQDLTAAREIARELIAGNVFINSIVSSNAKLPFGGVKHSGYGRELSHYGLKEFVNIKTVSMN